MDESNHDLIKY